MIGTTIGAFDVRVVYRLSPDSSRALPGQALSLLQAGRCNPAACTTRAMRASYAPWSGDRASRNSLRMRGWSQT
jgi:hypothetical protein